MDEQTKPARISSPPKPKSGTKDTEAHRLIERIASGEDIELQAHEAARIFHPLSKPKLAELAADIEKSGLMQPITLHPEGTILDGVNRYRACRQVGRPPKFEVWKGQLGNEIHFVLSRNLFRRHLSESQRGAIAGRIAKYEQGRPKQANLPDYTLAQAAKTLNISERTARKGRKVVRHAPENIVRLVDEDEVTVSLAEAAVNASDEQKAQIALMGDAEAIVAVKTLAQDKNATLAEKPSEASTLIRRLQNFLSQWNRATEPARAQLRDWLQQEPNVAALDALRDMAVPPSQDLAEPNAKS